MLFLCLAYGAEADWNDLTTEEQQSLLAQDEVLRQRGDLIAAVSPSPTFVRAWSGEPEVTSEPPVELPIPLAGFSVIEAADLDEAIALVAPTPCARARGMVEVRPITASNIRLGDQRGRPK